MPVCSSTTVHPRSCGEQEGRYYHINIQSGSSPLVRGTGCKNRDAAPPSRFIPARAGNSQPFAERHRSPAVHPRSCGEQIKFFRRFHIVTGSSPLVRGTVLDVSDVVECGRFIPARAGNRSPVAADPVGTPVHPRSCGEQFVGINQLWYLVGSSPLVRGTGPSSRLPPDFPWFIPARAGNRSAGRNSTDDFSVHPRSCGEQTSSTSLK